MTEINFEELVEQPGTIIANEVVPIVIQGEGISHPTHVKFILDTRLNNVGKMEGYVLTGTLERISKQLFYFERIDEWFALKTYLVRNGMMMQK